MTLHPRIRPAGLLMGALSACLTGIALSFALLVIGAAPARATFGVSLWEAGTCVNHTCTYAEVEQELKNKGHSEQAFTQASGHPPWGMTTFELTHHTGLLGEEPDGSPLKRVRVDVAPGLASNPQAPLNPETHQKCTIEEFQKTPPTCPAGTEVGIDEATVVLGKLDVPAKGKVFNLEPEPGEHPEGLHLEPMPLLFGILIEVEGVPTPERSYLEGHVSWAREKRAEERGIPSGDYHEWFEINNLAEKTAVLKSKLSFKGRAGGNFITLPSQCSGSTTNYIEVESGSKEVAHAVTHTPIGVEGCDKVPFSPTTEIKPETAQSDQPDGATIEVKVPQKAGETEINSAELKDAHVTLPEGLTLNPSAARGLTVCTEEQIQIGSSKPVECPASSKVGEVTVEADLPAKSLSGSVYLGGAKTGPITGPPYTIYLDIESARYGVSVRLKGQVNPNPSTGRVETVFLENPSQPFSDFIMKVKGGPQASLANSLVCGTENLESLFTPYTGLAASLSSSPFTTVGCPSSLPFSWAQSASVAPSNAGAYGSSYTFNLSRSDGQQYLSKVSSALPVGLVGAITAVELCGEPQAAQGNCSAASQIGTATVTAGAGTEPMTFSGPVYMTGPYGGGPFGLSIPVEAAAGPFDLGRVVTRATISVDPHTTRVSVSSSPITTIVGGVPVRLKSVSVTVNRSNFLYNPTSCSALATDTTLTSTFGATQSLSSPFQATNCGALAFTPSFTVSTSANTSKANGASLQVNVTQPAHQANIRSVVTSLPLALPTRLTTLQQACPEATYAANPFSCPPGSNVGSATATTPVLPGTLNGPAYLVSHGNAAFPDLDLILEGNGVRVILEGHSNIKRGITTTTFASLPDAPVSSFSLTLPAGPHSVLAANADLCAQPLVMPTTITAQNGAQVMQNTRISVTGCPGGGRRDFKILKRRVVGHTLLLKVQTFIAGRLIARGKYLKTASRKLRRPTITTLKLPLKGTGLGALRRHRPLKIRVRVVLVPPHKGEPHATASVKVAFKR